VFLRTPCYIAKGRMHVKRNDILGGWRAHKGSREKSPPGRQKPKKGSSPFGVVAMERELKVRFY